MRQEGLGWFYLRRNSKDRDRQAFYEENLEKARLRPKRRAEKRRGGIQESNKAREGIMEECEVQS